MSGRRPAGRTPAGRSFGATILITVIFYSKVMAHKLSWTFIPMMELFTQPFKVLLSAVSRWVTTARFYTSKVVVRYSRLISLTRYTIVHTNKIKVVFRILHERIVVFFIQSVVVRTLIVIVVVSIFFVKAITLDLLTALWGFSQKIIKGGVSKYCDIKGGIRK